MEPNSGIGTSKTAGPAGSPKGARSDPFSRVFVLAKADELLKPTAQCKKWTRIRQKDDDSTGAIFMTVDQVSTYSTPTPVTLDGAGTGTIYVGGRLSIDTGQAADTYTSTGTIAVNYQ